MNQHQPETPIVETEADIEEFRDGGYTRETRPSPSMSATLYDEGYIKKGNDGNLWKISVASNGVHRWQKLSEGEQSQYEEGDQYGELKSYPPPVEEKGQKSTFTASTSKTKHMAEDKDEFLPFADMVNKILTRTMFHYHVGDTISSAIGQPFFYKGKNLTEGEDKLIIRLEPSRQLNSPDAKYIHIIISIDRGTDTIKVTVQYMELKKGNMKKVVLWEGGGDMQGFDISDMGRLDSIIGGHKADMRSNFEKGLATEATPIEETKKQTEPMETTEPIIDTTNPKSTYISREEGLPTVINNLVSKIINAKTKNKDALFYNMNCRRIIDIYKEGYPEFPYEKKSDKPLSIVDVPADTLNYLSGYTGMGGLKFEEAGKEILYEYYTPDEIIQRMWGLAYKHGYKETGSVLEPSVATARFLKYAHINAKVVGCELNWYSYCIATLIYGHKFEIRQQYFEEFFIKNNNSIKGKIADLEKFDLVIGNPPYGNFQGKYAGMGEKAYTHARNQVEYFIFRGLDLLKPNGLLVYIIGAEVSAGGIPFLDQQMSPVKEAIAERGELIDAYRLPNDIFETTSVLTDIIVIRKK